jgi:hypothetical protein
MVCFWTLFHPSAPRTTLDAQYSQVITISPNCGVIGAPQLGHFKLVKPNGANAATLIGAAVWLSDTAFEGTAVLEPHFKQNNASSGSCVPQLLQNTVYSLAMTSAVSI